MSTHALTASEVQSIKHVADLLASRRACSSDAFYAMLDTTMATADASAPPAGCTACEIGVGLVIASLGLAAGAAVIATLPEDGAFVAAIADLLDVSEARALSIIAKAVSGGVGSFAGLAQNICKEFGACS